MGGIVGYIGRRGAPEIVVDGLRRLEDRGDDSAGLAVLGAGGLLASDIPAILPYTREMAILEDGEVALITREGVRLRTLHGGSVERSATRACWDVGSAQKSGVCDEGDLEAERAAAHALPVPAAADLPGPLVTVIPLRLLAYHIAARRGLDVDQPRNLAKSVTVE